ncbi:MAG: DNA-binding protein [Salinibacterium sp.]|nr:MAG: DNA-binding protein [Salinibacterium sp.]
MAERILVDVEGAAELLSMPPRLVHELTAAGVLPSVDLGRPSDRRYAVEALRAWAIERSVTRREEESDGKASGARRGPAVPAAKRRTLGRGRPRSGGTAPVPLRLHAGGRGREA